MSLEENKAIVKRHVEGWSNKNPTAAIDEVIATDYLEHETDKDSKGIEPLRTFYVQELKDHPDRSYTIMEMLAEGDKVAVMLVARYTDPMTRQPMTTTGINLYRVSDHKIVEAWTIWRSAIPERSV